LSAVLHADFTLVECQRLGIHGAHHCCDGRLLALKMWLKCNPTPRSLYFLRFRTGSESIWVAFRTPGNIEIAIWLRNKGKKHSGHQVIIKFQFDREIKVKIN
jgi:hypothetical protein